MSFYAIIGYFMNPVASLIGANKQIQNALIAADRLFEIMDLEREENTEKVVLNDISRGHACGTYMLMGENGEDEGTFKLEAMLAETSKPGEVSPMEVVPPET